MDKPAELPKSRFLEIGHQGEALTFSFERSFEQCLGLRLRWREAYRATKSALKSVGSVTRFAASLVVILEDRDTTIDDVLTMVSNIDQRLERIAARPLSARMVERALGITARERSRWTKDGRLVRTGSSLIRRGQLIALSTYAVDQIARLMNDPNTIQAWREADGYIESHRPRNTY